MQTLLEHQSHLACQSVPLRYRCWSPAADQLLRDLQARVRVAEIVVAAGSVACGRRVLDEENRRQPSCVCIRELLSDCEKPEVGAEMRDVERGIAGAHLIQVDDRRISILDKDVPVLEVPMDCGVRAGFKPRGVLHQPLAKLSRYRRCRRLLRGYKVRPLANLADL